MHSRPRGREQHVRCGLQRVSQRRVGKEAALANRLGTQLRELLEGGDSLRQPRHRTLHDRLASRHEGSRNRLAGEVVARAHVRRHVLHQLGLLLLAEGHPLLPWHRQECRHERARSASRVLPQVEGCANTFPTRRVGRQVLVVAGSEAVIRFGAGGVARRTLAQVAIVPIVIAGRNGGVHWIVGVHRDGRRLLLHGRRPGEGGADDELRADQPSPCGEDSRNECDHELGTHRSALHSALTRRWLRSRGAPIPGPDGRGACECLRANRR